jgi:sarcosine oxidase subunit alpha
MITLRTPEGGRVDRRSPIYFSFDGNPYRGLKGDTLASALLANGVHLVGRSFKYHRPRGILSAGAEEPNALVTVDRGGGRQTPNLRATTLELYEGMSAWSQNRWPSLAFDAGAINDALSPLFPAGFYYKTFMWPPRFWKAVYEPLIRRAAGLGRAPKVADPDRYLHRYAHCDVLVVGAGPAGLAAALAAGATGARVIVADEQSELGGALLAERRATIDGVPAAQWRDDTVHALEALGNVRLLPRTTAFGYFPDNFVGLAERLTYHMAHPPLKVPRERLWQVRAKEVVLATGAIERPLVFPVNDRPGVMLADAARTYVNRYGVQAGRRAVLLTADDSAYDAALDLKAGGVEVVRILDMRPAGAAAETARRAGIPVSTGRRILATSGRLRVSSLRFTDETTIDGRPMACDLLLMSGGWTPSVHLFSQSRGKLRYDERLQAFVPGTSAARERSAGACNGGYDLAACLEQGYAAGEAAARALRGRPAAARTFSVVGATVVGGGGVAAEVPAGSGKAFVDFQNDVTAKDIALAAREGYRSIEHVKRYTTTGMATDQGKTSNMSALSIIAGTLGTALPAVGLTTFRNPYTPVTFGTLAGTARGALFDPVRTTSTHDWATANGARFEDVGQWKRAHYFPQSGEDQEAAVARECKAVRTGVGAFDASTLGKIEVVGPDAAEFLNRIYTGRWDTLAVGRCRYGLILTEAGFVMDDGVVGRLAPDRFHVTTTTGGAARVLHHMEDYLQTEFPELKVWLTSVTEQWAVIAVQGPKARDVVAPLVSGLDLANAALPHMSVAAARVCGTDARLFRVSFTGELGYEINVPADYGRAVWEAVWAAGQAHGIIAYGTEAMHVMRAEKGYVIVGQETDGTMIPSDLGLDRMIAKAKPDFVGKRSLSRPDMVRPDRKQLVGLLTEDPQIVLEEGAQVVADPRQAIPMRMIGHVTSSYWSAVLGRSIALAMIEGGRALHGRTLYVPMPGRTIPVTVAEPVFYDPSGARLNA